MKINWLIIVLTMGTLWLSGWLLEEPLNWIKRSAQEKTTNPQFIKEYKRPPKKPIYQPLPKETKVKPNITPLPEEKPKPKLSNIVPLPKEKPRPKVSNITPLPKEKPAKPKSNYQPLED